MAVGTVRINLEASTAKFEKSLQSFNKKLDSTFDAISTKAKQVGIALTGIGVGLAYMTKKSIDSADSLKKVADKIGTTTEELSKLRYAADLTGVSSNTLDMAMQRFTRRLAEAANGTGEAKGALEEMNLSAKAMLQLPLEQRMQILADRFKAIENPADRVRIAMKLFDSEGVSLVNTLSNGSAELNKMTSEAQRLGLVIDTKTAVAAETFNDNMTRLTSKLSALGIKISNAVLPYLVKMTDYLINFFDNIDFNYLSEFIKKLDKLAMQIVAVITALASLVAALKIYSTSMILAAKATELFNLALKNNKILKFASWLGVLGDEANDLSKNFTDLLKQVSEVTGVTIPDLSDGDMIAKVSANYIPLRTKIDVDLKDIKTISDELEDKLSRAIDSESWTSDIIERINEVNFDPIKEKLKEFYDSSKTYQEAFADGLVGGLESMEDAFVQFAQTGKLSFSDMANSIIADLVRIAVRSQITAPLANFLGGIDWGSMFGNSGYTSYTDGWLSGARANGGQVSSNESYLVGEKGPEIFTPSTSGAIIPNNKLSSGGSSSGVVLNIENNSGIPITADSIKSKNDNGQEVISIIMSAVSTNKNGIRDMLKNMGR